MALMPVLLASDAVGGQGSFLAQVTPGRYEAFGLFLNGTHSATPLAEATDFGRVRLSEQGRDLVNMDILQLRRWNTLKGGFSSQAVTGSAAALYAWIIPRAYYDDNVHLVIESDLLQVQCQFGANFATRLPSGTMELYGFLRDTGTMKYALKAIQLDDSLAANATEPIPIRDENVLAVYYEDSSSITRIRASRDGEEVCNVARLAQIRFSDLRNQTDSLATANTEGTGANFNSALTEVQFAEPGAIGDFLSDDIQLEVTTSGAFTFKVVVVSADFTPARLRQSKVEERSIVKRKADRKHNLGRRRPIETIAMLAE